MAKINDTTTYPNTAPALSDHFPGTDISNTANDANGESVTFLHSAVQALYEQTGHVLNEQTGTTYTLVIGDRIVTMDNASANTLTIPTNAAVAFPIGQKLEIWQFGAGVTTIAGDTGVTLSGNGGSASAGSCTIQARYTGATLTKKGTNSWLVGGNISAVS